MGNGGNYTNQTDMLLDYLLAHGSITGRECMDVLGIMNYRGRISDVRKLGYEIKIEWVKKKNRQGRDVRFARYVLAT